MTTFSPTPKKCCICSHPFRKFFGVLMYDAVVYGRWGCLCHECFTRFNCKLGVGRGQKYEWKSYESDHWSSFLGGFVLIEGGSGTYLKEKKG